MIKYFVTLLYLSISKERQN